MNFRPRYLIYFLIPILILFTLVNSRGFVWPDEIFQTLEPAHKFLYGKGSLIWEFEFMARSQLYPFILSYFLFIHNFFFNSTEYLDIFFRVFLSIPFFILLFKIYSSFKETFLNSLFFFLSIGFMPIFYYFGFRTLTESISTLVICFILLELELNTKKLNKENLFLYSFFLSLMYGIRFQTGLFFIIFYPLFCFKLIQFKKENLIFEFIKGAILGILVYALVDSFYYKVPFISTYNYVYFNLVKKISLEFGTEPWYFFLKVLYNDYSILLIIILFGMYKNFKNFFPTIIGIIFYFLVHSFIAHKEPRFIFFIYPIFSFFLISGIIEISESLRLQNKKFFISILVLATFIIHFRSFQRIEWNHGKENLEIFQKISKLNLKERNILVGEAEGFANFGGYVYLSINFRGEIYYKFLMRLEEKEKNKFFKKNIIYLITNPIDSKTYCEKYKFCKKLTETKNFVFLEKNNIE